MRIIDTDFVIPENLGLQLPTLIFSELFTMTVTVTDPDFNFSELGWKSFRHKRKLGGNPGSWALYQAIRIARLPPYMRLD